MRTDLKLAKNAIANLGRGSAAAVLAVLLPPVLVRHMTPASYAAWVLVLQMSAYVGYLNFGLQTAIGRYVAFANELQDTDQRDSVFSTALVGLCGAAALSLVGLGLTVFALPAIFPSVPVELVPSMRLALLLVGFSMALDLPASACNGVFVGMARYEVPALTAGGGRLIAAAGIAIAALTHRSLVFMAATLTIINLLSYLVQYLAFRRIAPDLRFHSSMVRRSTARELYGYCLGLTVMSFSGLLVSGLDLTLVGHFDFASVIPYAVSASIIALISGALFAVTGVIMPHAAALHARQKAEELGALVVSLTRMSLLMLVLTGIPVLVYRGPILQLMVGTSYIARGASLLTILLIANMVRLMGAPYSIVLVAAGQQSYIKISPLAEGISNLLASVVLGYFFGGIGVAFGTLVGSFFSIASHCWYSMARTQTAIAISKRELAVSGVLSPLLWTCPLIIVGALSLGGVLIGTITFAVTMALSLAGAGVLILRTGSFSGRKLALAD